MDKFLEYLKKLTNRLLKLTPKPLEEQARQEEQLADELENKLSAKRRILEARKRQEKILGNSKTRYLMNPKITGGVVGILIIVIIIMGATHSTTVITQVAPIPQTVVTDNLTKAITTLQASNTALQDNNDKLTANLKQVNTDKATLQTQIVTDKGNIEQLSTAINTLQANSQKAADLQLSLKGMNDQINLLANERNSTLADLIAIDGNNHNHQDPLIISGNFTSQQLEDFYTIWDYRYPQIPK